MKKITIALMALVIALPAAVFAGGGSSHNSCKTRYPIVLAHGMGFRAVSLGVDYWWNIPGALRDEGATVYITDVNAIGSTAQKAAQWKQQVLNILAASGSSKLNVIAHSHGTLYTRYAISNLGLSSKFASYTSLCGPHRGSSLADVIMGIIPNAAEPLIGEFLDNVMVWIFGDDDPDIVQNGYDLTRSYMQNVFNPNTPNKSGIYYQSWGAKIKWPGLAHWYLDPTWAIIYAIEGANDGLVPVYSAKWGNYRGTKTGSWWCSGVNHFNMVDQLFGVTPGFNAPDFYVDIVSDLKDRGY